MNIYQVCSIDTLKKAAEIGKTSGSESEVYERLMSADIDCDDTVTIAKAAFDGFEIDFTIKNWYRIGEPRVSYYVNKYVPSHNFAEDRQERGISVVSESWLHSLKGIFFNLSNEKLRARGVWEIEGFQIGTGSDNEPIIFPTNWAKKTKVYSVSGIIKLLKKGENK